MIFKEFNPNEDDCHKVAKLVYFVDQKTYFKLFRSEKNAISAIETLLLAGKDDFVSKGTIFETGDNDSNHEFRPNETLKPHDIRDNREFYLILDENDNNVTSNNYNNSKEIIGLIQMVKGKKSGLFGDILTVFRNLKISDAFKFSFIYFIDYFILAETNHDDLYVAELAIDENERGKGLGTKVLKEIIEKAKANNFKRIVLDADFNNIGAYKLYKFLGFKVFDKKRVKLFNKEKGMNNMEYIL